MVELMTYLLVFEVIAAGILAYGIATSKVNSKKIIKMVLIGTAACALPSIIGVIFRSIIFVYIGLVLFPLLIIELFFYLGKQTGNKLNFIGFFSLVAYWFSLFSLPIISNKYEDSYIYALLDDLVKELGGELTPTQLGIINLSSEISVDSVKYLHLMFYAIIVCSVLFLCMTFLRKNAAQVVLGSIITVLTAGMLYFDYMLFHSKSLGGKLAGDALSELGFSLSISAVVILVLPILTVITAYICNKKDKENK